jgi:DNA helicase-2/ATP-dependent DNA helicase PcrA
VHDLGVPPSDILAITFTRKGSQEMKQRLKRELSPEATKEITVGTFHAIAFRILRRCLP